MMKSESETQFGSDAAPRTLRTHCSKRRYNDDNYDTFGGGMGGVGHAYLNTTQDDKPESFAMRRILGAVGVLSTVAYLATSAVLTRTSPRPLQTPPGTEHRQQEDLERDSTLEVGAADPSRNFALKLAATNEYGEFDQRALALYGLEMVVEPYRETKISVLRSSHSEQHSRFRWLLIQSDEDGVPLDGTKAEVDSVGGKVATVTLTQAGGTYALLVQQLGSGRSVVAEGRATITCKYVRREVRQLTDRDRWAFLAAMREFYTVSDEEGKAKYGAAFSAAGRIAAIHNSRDLCYHNGIHFLTAHAAFNLWVERTLQMIDPRVSLASWDFMLDAAVLGTDWPSSEIFGPDMFGSAFGTAEQGFQIKDGWFANISSLYDPADVVLTGSIATNHNPYGYVGPSFNYQDIPGVTRTHSFCGLKGKVQFATCDVFIHCFDHYSTLYDWAACMETQVHAAMHGSLGGGYNCNTDMVAFQQEHPQYSPELLSFILEYVLANKWPDNRLMSDYNECAEACDRGQTESCGCTCTTDPFAWEDDEVYDFMEEFMDTLAGRFHGDSFVSNDTSIRNSLGFKQNGESIGEASSMYILRQMMVIACEPGAVGAMSGGAAPLDPIFWVLHQGFEKALHILLLSDSYRDTYDMTWVDGTCDGSRLSDPMCFTEQTFGMGDGSEKLTNEEMWALLHPSNAEVPYLYDGFNRWGTCTSWDPCPSCVASPSDVDEVPPAGLS